MNEPIFHLQDAHAIRVSIVCCLTSLDIPDTRFQLLLWPSRSPSREQSRLRARRTGYEDPLFPEHDGDVVSHLKLLAVGTARQSCELLLEVFSFVDRPYSVCFILIMT